MNISKDEKKVLSYWFIIIVFILILFFLFYESKEHIDKLDIEAKEQLLFDDTNYVSDRNIYYTAKNAIDKYYSYINMKNYESLFNMLNKNYKEKNKISIDTLKSDKNYSKNIYFDTKEIMCIKSIKKSIIVIEIKGNEFSKDKDIDNEVFYELTLNYNNDVFDLSVVNEDSYNEVCNEKR